LCVPSAGKPNGSFEINFPANPNRVEVCEVWGTSGHRFTPPPGGGNLFECACGKFRHVAAERDLSEFEELVFV